ncbi:MAG TPA: polysaccharide pyruvyl transferase family protein [Kiritimatiellia bacterium]|nr:polysaccharide pyruvyl transferase family protein [Kiritimatiellia bacterium]HSA17362.1 polysaccharide pyruvyl transferase family protein [Kiritimatiellia bacterium]
MGNLGAEAITLAVIPFFQERWGMETRFILAAWDPARMTELLRGLPGELEVIKQTVPFDRPGSLRRSDMFVVCGDVALTETVIPILPCYWAFKSWWARLFGCRVLFLGVDAEPMRRRLNRWAIRLALDRIVEHYLVRNDEARRHLLGVSRRPDRVLLGCEPALLIEDRYLSLFPPPAFDRKGARRIVGLGIRDFFSEPLRLDPFRLKLVRRDAAPGQLSDRMKKTVAGLARIADRLAERHDARLFVVPHHALDESKKVILSDREVAEHLRRAMRNPDRLEVLPENLHPYAAMNFYRQCDLAVSMRHHTSSFAFRFGVPVIGLGVSEKIRGHFRLVEQPELLLDPAAPGDAMDRVVDDAVARRDELSGRLRRKLPELQADMKRALDAAIRND